MARLREQAGHIRLIATDLDGTLLGPSSDLTERTVRAVRMVRERGIAFTICTGRSFYELEDLPKILGLDTPVICRNGAEIVDPASGKTLFRRLIPEGEGAAFMRLCVAEGIDVCLTTEDTVYLPRGSALESWFENVRGAKVLPLDSETVLEGLAYYKIVLIRDQPKYAQARAFGDNLPGVRTIGAADEIDDLIAKDANKGDGLRWVAEHLGIDRAACCAFGDYANDVPMLQYAGLSFAMENAPVDVRALASFTAPPNTADGVAQVLETLFG